MRIIYSDTVVMQGSAVTLNGFEDVFVRAGVLLGSEDVAAIAGEGSGHIVIVEGEVVGGRFGIDVCTSVNHGLNDVIVRAGGQVSSSEVGINLEGIQSTLSNSGFIFGGTNGVSVLAAVTESGSSESKLTNTGIIDALSFGIYHDSPGLSYSGRAEQLVVQNTGTITGRIGSFFSRGESTDKIVNTGTMNGKVDLGGGDDLYDGRGAGKVVGTVFGGSGIDTLYGGKYADTLDGGTGNDVMTGGLGDDIYVVDAQSDVIVESANQGSDTVQTTVNYVLSGSAAVETVQIVGKGLGISASGNQYANTIIGNNFFNTLSGGSGNDRLTGGPGGDDFLFNKALSATANVDRITDFSNYGGNYDEIHLENAIFKAFAKTGAIAEGAFASNTSGLAAQADDRIVYETDTGKLFYDTNGNASGGSTLFAIIDYKPVLMASDFIIV